MDANKKAMLRNIRQALVVTLVLLLLCGFVFPVLLSGLSGLIFPHQAGGSLVTADGKAVGAKLVGQEFTEAYFMKGRPSAYHYNTYYTDEQGGRFYNCTEGRVTIDGVDISGVTLASLRAQMGLMMQESFVFTGTVMDNLRYGNLAAGDEELIRAAELVCADGFIRALPHGYDTVLTEGGAMLSQGEKQLLALARTMASDPKILILDEATSSVDTKTERELQEGVNRMLKGRTSFIVAHRLSTIRACNKIMYIDHGEIAECGTHEELLARKGLYWQLCQEM